MEENIPVLEPPPGFEDPPAVKDHVYDDPASEDDNYRSAFREVRGLGNSVRLRSKKTIPRIEEVYSLPVDSVQGSISRRPVSSYYSDRRDIVNEPIHMSLEEVREYLREIHNSNEQLRKRNRKSLNLPSFKRAFFNVFRIPHFHHSVELDENKVCTTGWTFSAPNISKLHHNSSIRSHRALPPLPQPEIGFFPVRENVEDVPTLQDFPEELGSSKTSLDFAASIEEVKGQGWYWGPLPGEMAEKILANEPDGSFLVRDSSDDRYIFSLSFKLNGAVRHVRIEHDQGNFSFGSVTKFRSQTMVEFIKQAVEHSRSGRFLFFLHRRPTAGPTRVQLVNPLSRFRYVQSLQHLCRFAILRLVRRDQIESLLLPPRLKDYLNTAHYYLENV